jgi:hypothetical protein
MSFSDRPSLTGRQKLGCLAYSLAGLAAIVPGLIISRDTVDECLFGCTTAREMGLLALPASLLLVVLGGLWLVRRMMRDEN